MTSAPYQMNYQNQLQFNLGVPLTAQNLAVQFQRPNPIFVERVGGHHGIPGKVGSHTSAYRGDPNVSSESVFNYSVLSEDKMEVMSQLARRDLRNRKLQEQMRESPNSRSPASSPSRTHVQSKQQCNRFARERTNKPRQPLTAKEAEKNRRFGAVQTPPRRKPQPHTRADESWMSTRNTSMNTTKESDVYFPLKPSVPEGSDPAKDEVEKLRQEMEGYLQMIEHIEERAIAERSTRFLHPPTKGKQKDGYLAEEENIDRTKTRVGEQNVRWVRNMYNLKQKVRQLQRDVAHADLSKPTKKSQIVVQLTAVHRGAVKAIESFVNQLPFQDLRGGLPSHYHELALLLRQLTALSSLTRQGSKLQGQEKFLTLLDNIDNLNAKWCTELKKSDPTPVERPSKSSVAKDWVSDTKVDKNIFVTKNKSTVGGQAKKTVNVVNKQQRQRPLQRGRPEKRAVGKENRNAPVDSRRAELQAGISSLLQQKQKEASHQNRAIAWEVNMGRQPRMQDPTKGYMLPSDLIAKREKAQKAVELSNRDRRYYASPTASTRLKMSPARTSSAPASPSKRKEVNFDLNRQSPLPWIPPGRSSSRSRSLSSERRSEKRSPFYVRDVDRDDIREMFPGKHSLRSSRREVSDIPSYGFRSLPNEKTLRSADVSTSFIDEVENRLMERLLRNKAQNVYGHTEQRASPYYEQNSSRGETTMNTTGEFFSEGETTLDTTGEVITRKAASIMDAPTLENIKLRLTEMQREQREIRQRWSSLKFTDTRSKSRNFAASDIIADRPRDPPAIELTRMSRTQRPQQSEGPINKDWAEEPLMFTKPQATSRLNTIHTVKINNRDDFQPISANMPPPKKLLSMKQTQVERINADRDRFQSYLRKRSHHPSGKFDPWKLVDEISDEILSDCLKDVSSEVEQINEEIANHMYKSEFMVDKSQSDSSIQKQQSPSPKIQPMVEKMTIYDGPAGEGLTSVARASPPIGGKLSLWGSGDQPGENADKSPGRLSLSTPRSPVNSGSARHSLNASATEPMLEDVSQFLNHRGDNSEDKDKDEEGEGKTDNTHTDVRYRDDFEEDEDDYSDEDFEDVSDVEL